MAVKPDEREGGAAGSAAQERTDRVPAVRLRSATRSYGREGREDCKGHEDYEGHEGGTVKTLDDVSLTIRRGTFTGRRRRRLLTGTARSRRRIRDA